MIIRGEDGRPKPPPYDLCIQHKEHVLIETPHTGMYQMSANLRNVYNHARLQCVTQKNVHFNPGSALKSQEVKSKLSNYLKYTLPIYLANLDYCSLISELIKVDDNFLTKQYDGVFCQVLVFRILICT